MKRQRYLLFLSILCCLSSGLAIGQTDSVGTSIFTEAVLSHAENKDDYSAIARVLERQIQRANDKRNYARQCGFRNRLALLLSDHGRMEESFAHLRKSLEIEQANNLLTEKGETVALFGYTYELLGKQDKAVEYFLQAAFLAE